MFVARRWSMNSNPTMMMTGLGVHLNQLHMKSPLSMYYQKASSLALMVQYKLYVTKICFTLYVTKNLFYFIHNKNLFYFIRNKESVSQFMYIYRIYKFILQFFTNYHKSSIIIIYYKILLQITTTAVSYTAKPHHSKIFVI